MAADADSPKLLKATLGDVVYYVMWGYHGQVLKEIEKRLRGAHFEMVGLHLESINLYFVGARWLRQRKRGGR